MPLLQVAGPPRTRFGYPQEKSSEQRRRFRAMVAGARADRRQPGSSERALFTRLLMGKGRAEQAPPAPEGKSLASSCPRCSRHHDTSWLGDSGISWPGALLAGLAWERGNGFALGKQDPSGAGVCPVDGEAEQTSRYSRCKGLVMRQCSLPWEKAECRLGAGRGPSAF